MNKATKTTNRTAKAIKSTSTIKATYRPVKVGAIKYRSARAAIRYYLTKTKMSQSDIARKLNVTPACVCQVANGY